MIAAVADTHTALWHLFDDARLSAVAGNFITEAATARRKIAISTISLAEGLLIEKMGKSRRFVALSQLRPGRRTVCPISVRSLTVAALNAAGIATIRRGR